MRRLVLFYRGYDENGRKKTIRITIPEPVDQIDSLELSQDMEALKTFNIVPENFEADEARIMETNVTILVNLIE